MSNSWTAKVALLVIATTISFSSPTNANEPSPAPRTIAAKEACRDLMVDAQVTCQVLTDGVDLVHPKGDPGIPHARSAAARLCKLWSKLAMDECTRGLEAAK